MAVVGYATVQLIPSMDGFTSAVKEQLGGVNEQISESTNKASSDAGKEGGSLFGHSWATAMLDIVASMAVYQGISAITNGIKDLFTTGFSDASFLQSATKSLTVLTGSAATAKTEMAALYSFAERTPFDVQDVIKYGQQLLGAGASAQQIVPDLQDMGDAIDAVGGSQADMTDAMLGFTQMMTRGTLDLQDLRQISNSGIPVMKELAKALGVPTTAIQAMISTGKLASDTVLPKLLAQMEKDYSGSMVAQSKTLAGAWSNVEDSINEMLGKAFTPLADWLATKLPAVATDAGNVINGMAKFFTNAVSGAKDLYSWFQKIFGDPAIKGFMGTQPAAPKLATFSNKEATSAPSFIGQPGVPAGIAKPVVEANKAPSFLNVLNSRPSFIPAPQAPADLMPQKAAPKLPPTDAQQTVTNLSQASSAWGKFAGDFANGASSISSSYGKWVAPLIAKLLPELANALTTILPPAINMLDNAWNVAVEVVKQVGPVFEDVLTPIFEDTGTVAKDLAQVVKGAFDIIGGALESFFGLMTGNQSDMKKGWDLVKSGYQDLANGVTKTLLDLGKFVTVDMVNGLTSAAGYMITGFNKGWGKAVTNFGKTLTQPFSDAITAIKKFLGIQSPSKLMMQIATDTAQGFINGWTAKVGLILTGFGNLGQDALTAVGNAKTWLLSKGEDAISGLASGFTGYWNTKAEPWLAGLGGDITGAVSGLGGILEGAGESIMGGFLSGLEAGYEKVKSLVGGVAEWIKDHKGPISYDKVLLTPAGQAIMDGLRGGIESQLPALGGTLAKVTSQIQGVNLGTSATGSTTSSTVASHTTVNQTFVTNNPVSADPIKSIRTAAQTARAHMNLSFA